MIETIEAAATAAKWAVVGMLALMILAPVLVAAVGLCRAFVAHRRGGEQASGPILEQTDRATVLTVMALDKGVDGMAGGIIALVLCAAIPAFVLWLAV